MRSMRLRIIIIDDEECIRDSLAMHLEAAGHEVMTHEKAALCPALKGHDCHLQKPCADIILVDHLMPGVTGLELLKTMTRKGCHIVPPNRIIMTGNVTPELEADIARMGCQIVQKPLRFEELDLIIKKASALVSTSRVLSVFDD